MPNFIVVAFASFIGATILTWQVRRMAIAHDLLDRPNTRSSHSMPVPRGGGLAIVCAASLGFIGLNLLGELSASLLLAFMLCGLAVAGIGFLDDRRSVSASFRLTVHACVAVTTLYILGGVPALQFGSAAISFGILGNVVGVVSIIWALNLYNFMDGIDGIAASEAIFVCVAGALVGSSGCCGSVMGPSFIVAAASLGFLLWNWPPARIFMGDVGSGYLGFTIAVLALSNAQESPVALYIWLILGGVFFVDATVTLIRRVLRGEKASAAHRSHAYQWLSRRWKSHGNVTLGVQLINIAWLLPMAVACRHYPEFALYITAISLAPLALLAWALGAGRPEAN